MSVSVCELLADVESVTPAGARILAVFASVPVAPAATVAVSEKVAVPPFARLTVVEMLPVPLATPQLEPAEATQVHVAFFRPAGNVSLTAAPATALGPLLVATIV